MSYTTPGAETLLPSFRAYLVELGFVRNPNTQGDSNSNPFPLWLDPAYGVPYPGQAEDVGQYGMHPTTVLAAYPSTGIPSQPYEGFIQTQGIMLWYRSTKSPTIRQLHEQLRPYIHDKRNFSMAGLVVNQVMLSRELQRISSDDEGFVYNCEIMFDLWSATWVA